MKINCEKCQAKYSIADEKVRGKTFKIRCKKCGHVIIVRDKGAAAAGSGADAAPAAASAPEPAGWHVAVGGETIGPLSEHDIRARIEQGEYRQDASVWRDGFEDWVPMHTVEEFRSVLERFSEDNSASSGSGPAMGGSASPDLGGSASGGNPQSPRVQSLTGQRNENSVLFSLDSLQKVGSGAQATGTASSGAAAATLSPGLSQPAEPLGGPGGTFTPSTAAPTSEGSGLIDIRAMSQVLSSQGAAEAKRDDNVLPSFGGSGLGGLSAQPVAVEEPLPVVQDRGVAPAPVQSKSNVGLILAATLGSVGLVLGLGYFFVVEPMMAKGASDAEALNKAQLAVVEERAKFAEQELERTRKEQEAALEQAKLDAQTAQAAGATARPAQPAAAGNAGGGRTPKRGEGRRRPGAAAGAGQKPAAGGAAAKPQPNGDVPAPSKKKAGGSDGNIDVDCLLDPNLPKCKKSGGRKPKKSGGGGAAPKASADPNLPQSLTQAQLLGGLRLAKTRAKGCGKKNGAAAGTRVRVRMSISGSTGKVTSAVPQGEHVGTPLGKCVAAAASKATFPKFKKSSQGLQYNFKM